MDLETLGESRGFVFSMVFGFPGYLWILDFPTAPHWAVKPENGVKTNPRRGEKGRKQRKKKEKPK